MFGLLGVVLAKNQWITIKKCWLSMNKDGRTRWELLGLVLMTQKKLSKLELSKRIGTKLCIWLCWVGKDNILWSRISKFRGFLLCASLINLGRSIILAIRCKFRWKKESTNFLTRKRKVRRKRRLQLLLLKKEVPRKSWTNLLKVLKRRKFRILLRMWTSFVLPILSKKHVKRGYLQQNWRSRHLCWMMIKMDFKKQKTSLETKMELRWTYKRSNMKKFLLRRILNAGNVKILLNFLIIGFDGNKEINLAAENVLRLHRSKRDTIMNMRKIQFSWWIRSKECL